MASWNSAAAAVELTAPARLVCCWPRQSGFVAALAELVRDARARLAGQRHRVLFTAHGLPEKVVAGGDPYQWQVEATVTAVLLRLAAPDLDWTVCYQSRATPQVWWGEFIPVGDK